MASDSEYFVKIILQTVQEEIIVFLIDKCIATGFILEDFNDFFKSIFCFFISF